MPWACTEPSTKEMAMQPIPVLAPFQLWRGSLDSNPDESAIQELSASERARAARFVFERDRRRYLSAHDQLRRVLAGATGLSAAALRYREGTHGKPYLDHDQVTLAFNMSHSQDTVVIALRPSGEIGVDVEMLRPMSDVTELAARNFTPAERAQLARTPPAERDAIFLRGWTRKEACLKALGSGLSVAPDSFHVGLEPDERVTQLCWNGQIISVRVWSLLLDETTLCALAHVVESTRTPPAMRA